MKKCSALPKRSFFIPGILAFALAFTTMPPPAAFAQQAATTDQQEAKQPLNDDGLEPLPLSPIEKAERDGTAIYVTLQDIAKLALQNNIDIAIEETNELTSQQNLKSSEGGYDPSLQFTLGLQSRKSPNTRVDTSTEGEKFSTSKSINWNATFSQPVKTGGTLQATWRTSRASNTEAFSLYNPEYSTSASVTFTQPLWKDLKIDSTRGQIKIRKLDLETSDITFKQTVTTRVSQIMQAYWDLVSAIRNYDIQRNSMKLAMINLRDNRKRVDVGTQAPITIIESEFRVADRRQMVNSAEETILRQLNNMRQYITNDMNNEIWSKVIVPKETPAFQEYRIDPDTAIETAMANSPDLRQSDLELQKADINLKMAKNSRGWGVDLQGTLGSQGSAGDPGPLNLNPPPEYIGGVGTAYDNLFTQGLINWSVQVTVDVPLRNRAADASYANQLITNKRTLLTRKRTEQQLLVQVRNAYQALQTARLQVETAELGKRLAQEQLDGEEKRYDAGLTENYRVLEQQENLARAENDELSRLISYKQSIITLQELMNTLLEESDFEISRSAADHIPELK